MKFSVDADYDDFGEGTSTHDSQTPPSKKPRIHFSNSRIQCLHDNNNTTVKQESFGDKNDFDHLDNQFVKFDAKDADKDNDCGKILMGCDGNELSISVTLTDPDVLDCPVCRESLTIPVFQCENGHVACASCCIKISNKCPSCSWPIGYNRCRAIENVIESIRVSCENIGFGCKERIVYCQKYEHENACVYAPCSCPIDNCNFVGPVRSLYAHFDGSHANSADHFQFNCPFPVYLERDQGNLVLREQTDGTIFILNHSYEVIGHAFDVVCVLSTPAKKRFYYDIVVCDGDSKLKLQSSVGAISNARNCPVRKRLLVPNDFVGSSNFIKLELCICNHSNPQYYLEGGCSS